MPSKLRKGELWEGLVAYWPKRRSREGMQDCLRGQGVGLQRACALETGQNVPSL